MARKQKKSIKPAPTVNRDMFRQGDVLIRRVAELPADVKPAGTDVLVHGEATGHAHRLVGGEHLLGAVNERALQFVRATQPVTIVHEEHGTIHLPAGTYEISRQREYSPEEVRNVAD